MQQPKSIERFEQLYFIGLVLGLALQILNWNKSMEAFQQSPTTAAIGLPMMLGSLVVGLAISLSLWFFIARRGSEVAKWIYVVLTGLGLLAVVAMILLPRAEGAPTPDLITRIGQGVGALINIVSLWFLFQPDTRPWFNKGVDPTA